MIFEKYFLTYIGESIIDQKSKAMHYTCEIDIDKPRHEVVKLFENTDNMKYWQKGLVNFEHISGEPGKPGAESLIKYDMGKRKIEMIETVTFNKLPEEFHANFLANGVTNIQKNYFSESDGKTKWVSDSEFKFTGLMKLMAFFMGKKTFQKQSQSYLEDFKSFAEGNPKYG